MIQKSGQTLKMNNSKTNQDTKIRIAPNGWKRSRVLCGKEIKNSSVGDQQMALSYFWCRIMQSNKRYKKEQLQQVKVVDAYMHRNIAFSVATLIPHGLQDLPIWHPVTFGCGDSWKSNVYRDQPASLAALKDAIRQNVSAITQEMLLNAVNDVVNHLTVALLNDGHWTVTVVVLINCN